MATAEPMPLADLLRMMTEKQSAVDALAARRAGAAPVPAPNKRKSLGPGPSTIDPTDVFGLPFAADLHGAKSSRFGLESTPHSLPAEPLADAGRKKPGRKPGRPAAQPAPESPGEEDEEEQPKKGRNGRPPPQSEKRRREQNRAAQKAWRERKEKHLRDLEEKVKLYESQDGSIGSLYEENEKLKAMIQSLQQENLQLRETAFTFVPPSMGMPGTTTKTAPPPPAARGNDIFAASAGRIAAVASPPLTATTSKRSPPPGDDTGYSSGYGVGSPAGTSDSAHDEPSPPRLQGVPGFGLGATLELANVLKDMDPKSAEELLVELLRQQAEAAQAVGGARSPAGALNQPMQLPGLFMPSPPSTGFGSPPANDQAGADLDRLLSEITKTTPPATAQPRQPSRADSAATAASSSFSMPSPSGTLQTFPDWGSFDPQVVDLMSVILPQATDDYGTLQQYLPADYNFADDFETLLANPPAAAPPPPQQWQDILGPIGIGIPANDLPLFNGAIGLQPAPAPPPQQQQPEPMDWQHMVAPTKTSYRDVIPLVAKFKPPELRLPDSAIRILRNLDMSKVPCTLLRGKLEALRDKYQNTNVVTLSDEEFSHMMRKRIAAMAKAMGRSRLTQEEEALLVEMMANKATVEVHAEQLADALNDIQAMADDPSAKNAERVKRVQAAFATCPSGDSHEPEIKAECI
ncbi:hypothetical protein DFJ74DRAFT_702693 [Hyaloraphidium curvatum]|nr:hypothetical protein DFJ74DRAFT_702693 [Hyaloraphidium curvatum]